MTKDQQKEVAWKEYLAILEPAQSAYRSIRGPAHKAYRERCREIDEQEKQLKVEKKKE